MQVNGYRGLRAFTLVELLVVILIISVLLTLGAMTLRGAQGKSVLSSVATTESLFDEARSVAVGKGTKSRVLIDVDDPENDNYLRRMLVVQAELDDDGKIKDPEIWKATGQILMLPDGIFYSREFSKRDHEGQAQQIPDFELSTAAPKVNGRYAYYEFNSEGICTTGLNGTTDYTGPSFVLGSGSRTPGEDPTTTSGAERDFGGFVVWRNGSTSLFKDPEQILGRNTDPKKF